MSAPTSSALSLRDVFNIPERTGTDDYVLKLSTAVDGDQLGATVANYVVTPELAHAFDQALAVVEEAQRTGDNKAAFLEGSFGSGKSHFMAVLHALLGQDSRARSITALQPALARHTALESAKILRLTFHFLDSDSIESALFSQYLTQIRTLHPDTPAPVLHSAAGLFDDAAAMRRTLGDEAFFAGLNRNAPAESSPWAKLGVASATWDSQRYEAATDPAASTAQRAEAKAALIESHFSGFTRNSDWLPLEEGLEIIAAQAKSLGYQGVVLLLDELVLWLTFIITERERLNREVQKITKLVEGSRGRLAVPITSIIARQHDLRRWLGTSTDVGADQDAFERALVHQSGRFATIVLGDENLPAIVHQRLLQPKNQAAKDALAAAFSRVDRSPVIWDVLRNNVNTSEENRGSDTRAFQLTYPFSPALIDTLKNVAGLMQRERTALKVMQKMLVDNADRLTIDNVIPVGEAFDDIVTGTTTSSDPQVTSRFKLARDLWNTKLRPFILTQHGVPIETPDRDLPVGPQAEVRLAKTLILASIAPNVPALMQITAKRLAALNHGSIREVLPGDAAAQALRKVKQWRATIPEVKLSDEGQSPVITVTLAEVDYESVVARARGEDTEGRRRDLVRDMLYAELGVAEVETTLGGVRTREVIWRGTRREVDIVYGNVRDPAYLPDDQFRARQGVVRVVIDYPFDTAGFAAREDHARIDRLAEKQWETPTVVWLPTFLTEAEGHLLGRLVVLNTILRGETWAAHSAELSEVDRPQARAILEAQQQGIRGQLGSILQQVYGAAAGRTFPEGEEPLRSLSTSFQPRRPVGASLGEAADRLLETAYNALYPDHPQFSPADRLITDREINLTLKLLRQADAHADGRIALERQDREIVRRIVTPLELAKVNETHLIFTASEFTTWDNRIAQALSRAGVDTTEPVEVAVLRDAIDPIGSRRGLTPAMADLLVGSWASRHRRAWYKHGTAVDEPATIKDMEAVLTLRTEPLPANDSWEAAVTRFGTLFAADRISNEFLTANNLATFVRDAVTTVTAAMPDQERLVQKLTEAYVRFGLDEDQPRLAMARSILDLFTALSRSAQDRVAFIERLAAPVLTGSDSEAGRSVASAKDVAQVLAGTRWESFRYLQTAAESQDIRAQLILTGLLEALKDQEHNKALVAAMNGADDERQRWLEERAPRPEPTPPGPVPPGPKPPGPIWPSRTSKNTFRVKGAGDWKGLESSIDGLLSAYPGKKFEIDIRVLDDPDPAGDA